MANGEEAQMGAMAREPSVLAMLQRLIPEAMAILLARFLSPAKEPSASVVKKMSRGRRRSFGGLLIARITVTLAQRSDQGKP